MKNLHFIYSMHSQFSAPVTGHSFTLKCIPETNPKQEVTIKRQKIGPANWISESRDAFDNLYLYGKEEKLHDTFEVYVEGEALVGERRGYVWNGKMFPAYAYPTATTTCDEAMLQFLAPFQKRRGEDFDILVYDLMQAVYGYMEYVPGATGVKTTAQEAFALKKGVCQDYAHILISLCKKLGIPAGYVAGYMVGEGASHAWVCVNDPKTERWYEIDPTNDRWVDDGYISIAYGLDAQDCIMNKGIYCGFAEENQTISVVVEEIPENA